MITGFHKKVSVCKQLSIFIDVSNTRPVIFLAAVKIYRATIVSLDFGHGLVKFTEHRVGSVV